MAFALLWAAFAGTAQAEPNPPILAAVPIDEAFSRAAAVMSVRRQNIWHNSRRKLAECWPRLGLMFRRLPAHARVARRGVG